MNVVLIRPGETEFDRDDRIQGTLNLPLTATGREQIQEIARQLQSSPARWQGIRKIYAAATEPAPESARILGQALGLPIFVLDDLANLHHGLWQGKMVEEIRSRQPRVYRQWEEAPCTVCPPEGETCLEAVARLRQALRKALKAGINFLLVAPDPIATLIAGYLESSPLRVPTLSRCHSPEMLASAREHAADQPILARVGTWDDLSVSSEHCRPVKSLPGQPIIDPVLLATGR